MKIVSINRIKELWNDGVIPSLAKKIDKTKILTTEEQVTANTSNENVASAPVVKSLINDLTAMTDSGAIKGLDAREDGVYITYVPSAGADPVTKKLGSNNCKIKINYSTSASWESSHTRVTISAQLYKDDTLINTINILDAHVMGNPVTFNNIEYAFPD